jgi:hypothetical protein
MNDMTPLNVERLVAGEPSLADALKIIAEDGNLSAAKKQHWSTSIRSLAWALEKPLEFLPCRMTALRHAVSKLNAAAFGWAPKTLANHKANLRAAVLHVRRVEDIPLRGAPLSPSWQALIGSVPEKKPKRLLSSLSRYCSAKGIEPHAVDEDIVLRHLEQREMTSFLRSGLAVKREMMRAWNHCTDTVPNWPGRKLIPPGLPSKTNGPVWSQFPDDLQKEVAGYLDGLRKQHRSSNGRRRRPCKDSTIATRRRELEAYARMAVTAGKDISSITALEKLLSPAVAEATLEAYVARGGEKATTYVIDLSWKLLSVAKAIGTPNETVEFLDEARARLEQDRGPPLTEKNLTVIRKVMHGNFWPKVLHLPKSLFARARRMLNHSPQKAASLATTALQIAILTRAPIRIGNLMSIKLGANLKREPTRENAYQLFFPGYDVKNRISIDHLLTGEVVFLIDDFLNLYRTHLAGSYSGDWLFPGENGRSRRSAHASAAIADLLEKEIGVRMTAHQFRHAAAAIILKHDPGNYELARQILGHRNVATTERFYIALEAFAANKKFHSLLDVEGSKLTERKSRQRQRTLQD